MTVFEPIGMPHETDHRHLAANGQDWVPCRDPQSCADDAAEDSLTDEIQGVPV